MREGDERCAVTDRRQAGRGGGRRTPLTRLRPQGLLESPAVRSEEGTGGRGEISLPFPVCDIFVLEI